VALLATQHSTAVLREIAEMLGLKNRNSVHQKINPALNNHSSEFKKKLAAIEGRSGR
jgi:hypothetical protein